MKARPGVVLATRPAQARPTSRYRAVDDRRHTLDRSRQRSRAEIQSIRLYHMLCGAIGFVSAGAQRLPAIDNGIHGAHHPRFQLSMNLVELPLLVLEILNPFEIADDQTAAISDDVR